MNVNKVIFFGRTLLDLTADTVTAETLFEGYTAHDKSGTPITGSFVDLPYKQELEYIKSSGTQWIDTGFVPTANTRIESDFAYSDLTTNYEGIYTSGSWCMFGINGNYEIYLGNKYAIGEAATTDRVYIVIDVQNKSASIGENVYSFSSATYSASSETLPIFAYKNASGILGYSKKKQYGYKIYDNDTLVRDFIPVLDNDDIPCLYDKVNNEFYYNAGTGSFTYG